MFDFFDERHWWNKPVPGSENPLKWCPLHNRYYVEGQTCLRCDFEGCETKEGGGPSKSSL